MPAARMLWTARRRALLAVLAVAAPALALLGPLAAQAQEADVVEVDLDVANCFGHHSAETPPFRTTVLLTPQPLLEVPAGQEFDLPIQVQVAWKQEMRNLKIALNLSQAPNLAFVGEKEPLEQEFQDTAQLGQELEFPFLVEDNATEAVVTLDGEQGIHRGNDLDLRVVSPGLVLRFNKTVEDNSIQGIREGRNIADEEVRLTQDKLLDGGKGEWRAVVNLSQGDPLGAPFTLSVRVYYNSSRSVEAFVPVGRTLAAGEIANVTFRVRALAAGQAVVGVRSLGWAHYIHTDAQAVDDGNFSKTQTMSFAVGSSFRVQRGVAGVVDVGFDPATRLMRQWGFLLGWLGFFLIAPSLLLGGTFGGGTVRALNRFAGSARQRVLWHNALSYVLLAVGLTHMSLFLVEVTYPWTVGAVWGAMTLASIIGLGVTGALQLRIAKVWGYATWRFAHFLLGMLVVVGITLHLVVEGVDFQFLRDYFL